MKKGAMIKHTWEAIDIECNRILFGETTGDREQKRKNDRKEEGGKGDRQ